MTEEAGNDHWELALASLRNVSASKQDTVLESSVNMRHALVDLIGPDARDPKVAAVVLKALADNDRSILSQKRLTVEENDADRAALLRESFLDIVSKSSPRELSASLNRNITRSELVLDATLSEFEFVVGEDKVGEDVYAEGEKPELATQVEDLDDE